MDRETDNPQGGTDNAHPSEADTPETWDYYDPDEDNVEDQDEGTEDEVDPEPKPEAEEAEGEAEEQDEDEQPETGLVTLADGTQVSHDELVQGYLRQSDYTRKAQENANLRRETEDAAKRIEAITQNFADHLAAMIPAEPDPALAYSDSQKYMQQKAQYDAAMAQVLKLTEVGGEAKAAAQELSEADHGRLKASELQKLAEHLPTTATREGQERFLSDVQAVAKEAGFTQAEVGQIVDHRFYLLANLASEGLKAREAKAKAKAKVRKEVPPVAPRKPGGGTKVEGNRKAMRKLDQTGSIHDAVMVDFD